MSDVTDENNKNIQQESGEESELKSSNETGGGKAQTKPNILRGLSYMVLLIGAVFVINAMSKSCCRVSWTTVSFIATLGFGLLVYSFYHKSHDLD